MKSLLVFLCLCLWLMLPGFGQHILTSVDSIGLSLQLDSASTDRIVIDGINQLIELRVNDSLVLEIDGGMPSSFLLVNTNTGIPVGIELRADGSYAMGEFSATESEARAVMSIRNGVFRPAPNTQGIATNFNERLRITSNGDVGIGTLQPVERLDINGGIRIGFVPEEPTLDRLLVVDPEGRVKHRLVSSLPPPMGGIAALEEQNLQLRQGLAVLSTRVEQLERLLKNSDR